MLKQPPLTSVKFPGSDVEHTVATYQFRPIIEAISVASVIFFVILVTSYFVYFEAKKALTAEIGRGLIATANSIAARVDFSDIVRFQNDQIREDYPEFLRAYRSIELEFRAAIDANTQGSTELTESSQNMSKTIQNCFADARRFLENAEKILNDESMTHECELARQNFRPRQRISFIYSFRQLALDSDRCKDANAHRIVYVSDAGVDLSTKVESEPEMRSLIWQYVRFGSKSKVNECYIIDTPERKNEELSEAFRIFSGTKKGQLNQTGFAESVLRDDGKFGFLISGYAPQYNSDGEFQGLLGVDINAGEFESRIKPLTNSIFRTVIAGFFIAFMIGALVWFLRNFTAVINTKRVALAEDASDFVKSLGSRK